MLRITMMTTLSILLFALLVTTGESQAAPVRDDRPTIRSLEDASATIDSAAISSTLWLPAVTRDGCAPWLTLSSIPDYGDVNGVLVGQTGCITSAEYAVAVYIFVEGWWTKPTFAEPLTSIAADGAWAADVVTGGADQNATRLAAFLLPAGYAPPLLDGQAQLPQELLDHAVAQQIVERPDPAVRTLTFSGRTWTVKRSETLVGPGPNYFSDQPEDVWVDAQGRLHLRITARDGRWVCTEVVSTEALGLGTYSFALASRVDLLDPNVVLGLFTWDGTAPEHNYREIDIEFSRWGEVAGANAQYVVQPWDHAGNRERFSLTLDAAGSTHHFTWRADAVIFASYRGLTLPPDPGAPLATWTYTGADIPPAGAENARINLWLMGGAPPSDAQPVEVIVTAFAFTPAHQSDVR